MTTTSPYRGLAPYGDSEDDAQLFFGRERDTEIVVANLIASRLTVLYGASGVGKSSLLRAAVARQLRELPERPLVIVHGSWRDVALGVLAEAVEPGGSGSFARRVLAAARERDVYLILDQVEELILYHGDDARLRREAAEVLDVPARVNLLLSIRDDALAELDRFKAVLPGIYGNAVRLDRLDRAGGRAAIVGPVERWNELHGTRAAVEPELVEAVLDGVGEGEIDVGRGRGVVAGAARASGIEAPFLQLVMQRLWQESSSRGDAVLTRNLLDRLGGTGRVVADHLAGALAQLSADQRDVAAEMFHHLVTPGGSKILHELGDLAMYAGRSEEDAASVLETLAEHRIVRRHADESGRRRYEIFHDVLAPPVLAWRAQHVTEARFQQALEDSRRRRAQLGKVIAVLAVGFVALLAITVYALVQAFGTTGP
jgi:hypothetical protein